MKTHVHCSDRKASFFKIILKNTKQAILSTMPNIVSKTKYIAVCVHVLSHESDVKFI